MSRLAPESAPSATAFILTDHDVVVHQATGMVLAQLDVPVDDALARLRGLAVAEERLLVDVARDVVARRLVLGT